MFKATRTVRCVVGLVVVIRTSNDMHVNFSSERILFVLHPFSSSVLVLGGVSCLVQVIDFEYVVELLQDISIVSTQM